MYTQPQSWIGFKFMYQKRAILLALIRFIKQLTRPEIEFGSYKTPRRTLRGFGANNTIGKGQVQGVEKGDTFGSSKVDFSNFSEN